MTVSRSLRYVAFALMALFGLVGGLFVIGETFTDPGGWTAVWLTALWLLPLAALALFALLRPQQAGPVLVVATGLVLAFAVADSLLRIIPRDEWGPVTAVSVFSVGVALAFLGLHRARLAGLLMVVAALTQFAAIALGFVVHGGGDGPGPGAMLGGSSGVMVTPLLLAGALFLLADGSEHRPPARRTTGHQPAH